MPTLAREPLTEYVETSVSSFDIPVEGAQECRKRLRAPSVRRDGTFEVGATKTVAVPVEGLFEAFVDARPRERWLPGTALRERTSQPARKVSFDWGDGDTRVQVGFTALGEARSQAALQHDRLPNAQAAAQAKTYWRERLSSLKVLLEG